jgi:hypothetical protein
MKLKVVLHKGYGGFDLSEEALEMLIDLGWKVSGFNNNHCPIDNDAPILYKAPGNPNGYAKDGYHLNWFDRDLSSLSFRSNVDLVNVVSELGLTAGKGLVVEEINIENFIYITDNDGYEDINNH